MGLISNGTTIFDAGAMAAGTGGSMVFIKKLTASTSSTVDFVDGTSDVVLDGTYKEYLFTFNNMHPSAGALFQFQGNASGGSGFNETMTTTFFYAIADEADTDTALTYKDDKDLAQSTDYATISADGTNVDNDGALSGYLHLFAPSSTTFVKHYVSRISNPNGTGASTYMCDCFSAGYFNTTSAIDEISFKFASGNIDAGDICLYGIL
tara:strand:+ start:128 stop:751 length:624 start_codon:yes stop_codon:yes gene_type:complete